MCWKWVIETRKKWAQNRAEPNNKWRAIVTTQRLLKRYFWVAWTNIFYKSRQTKCREKSARINFVFDWIYDSVRAFPNSFTLTQSVSSTISKNNIRVRAKQSQTKGLMYYAIDSAEGNWFSFICRQWPIDTDRFTLHQPFRFVSVFRGNRAARRTHASARR